MRDSESLAGRLAETILTLSEEAEDVTIAIATKSIFTPFPGELATWDCAISGKDGSIVRVTIVAHVAEQDVWGADDPRSS
jgi:hypothetical protein